MPSLPEGTGVSSLHSSQTPPSSSPSPMPSNPEGVGPPSGAPEFFIIGSPDEPAKESDAEGDEYLFEAFHDPHALPSDVPAEAPLPAMPLVVPSVNESLDASDETVGPRRSSRINPSLPRSRLRQIADDGHRLSSLRTEPQPAHGSMPAPAAGVDPLPQTTSVDSSHPVAASHRGLVALLCDECDDMSQAFQDAHEVFTEDFPECAFVTMRELRAKEIPARECVGKEWDDSRLREHQSWQDNKGSVRRRRSDLPRGTKVIKTRWVYTRKPDGTAKSRLTVRGDLEARHDVKEGRELVLADSPTASRAGLRMFFAIGVQAG